MHDSGLQVPLAPPTNAAGLSGCVVLDTQPVDQAAYALACRAMMNVAAGRVEAAWLDAVWRQPAR